MSDQLRAPGYLPAAARQWLPWTRRHVLRVQAWAKTVPLEDLWDAAVTALLRATVYHDPKSGPFGAYARTAVHRACWRYCVRDNRRWLPLLSGDDARAGMSDQRDAGLVDVDAPVSDAERAHLNAMLRQPSVEEMLIALERADKRPAAPAVKRVARDA